MDLGRPHPTAFRPIPVLPQPLYSPDLEPVDYYLFLKVKTLLKERRFASSEKVKTNETCALREVTKDGLQDCFKKWYGCCQKCVTAQGAYSEGGGVKRFHVICNKIFYTCLVTFLLGLYCVLFIFEPDNTMAICMSNF